MKLITIFEIDTSLLRLSTEHIVILGLLSRHAYIYGITCLLD
jgi:hypothetical protein